MREAAIVVKDFRKLYGQRVAVDSISFSVQSGQIYGLLGPNGAGKTSTLESLEGLRRSDGGTLRIMGIDPLRQRSLLRHQLGVQLQSSALPSSLTPREALRLFCAYRNIKPPDHLLDRFGLGDEAKTQYESLSTGQKRRLALALAVAHRPPVVILDEPTAGLDVQSRALLHTVVRELKAEGTAVLLSTHDMAEAEALADRVGILLQGQLVTEGTPRQLTATGERHTKITVRTTSGSLAMSGPFPKVCDSAVQEDYYIYRSTDIGTTIAAIIQFIDEQGDRVEDMRVERPSLEERFLEITDGERIK